jgi:hypothetical protein
MDVPRLTALLQTRTCGQWTSSGPAAVIAADTSGTVFEAGCDFAVDVAPEHDDWRVLVLAQDQARPGGSPVVIRPDDIPELARGSSGARRRTRARGVPPRVDGPVSEVTRMVQARAVEPGQAVLLTRERGNSSAADCTGPWFPARVRDAAETARVRSTETTVRAGVVARVTLVTTLGRVENLDAAAPLIPV